MTIQRGSVGHPFYTILVDYGFGTDPIFIGFAQPGTLQSDYAWRILGLTWDANHNLTSILHANGSTGFTSNWDERGVLPYA